MPTLYFQWPETEKSLFGMRWHLVHLSQRKVPALFRFRNSTEIWRKRSVTDTSCVCFLVWVSYGLGRCCKLTDVQSEILVFWGGTGRPQQRELLSQTHLEPSTERLHPVAGHSLVQVDQSGHLCFHGNEQANSFPGCSWISVSVTWEENVTRSKIILCFPSSNFCLLFYIVQT